MKGPPLLVTGAHRSGTTWVGSMLSLPKNVAYIHEPFNMVYKPSGYGIKPDHWFQYIYEGNETAFYHQVQGLVNFKPVNWREANFQSLADIQIFLKRNYEFLKYRLSADRPLFKDPLALYAAPWLHNRFGFLPIVLIRHPAAFVYSVCRQAWRFDFLELLNQKRLMEHWLSPYYQQLKAASGKNWSPVAEATLLWEVIHHVIATFQEKYPEWLFVKHEDLAMDPESKFQLLYSKLGLNYDTKTAKTIRQYAAKSQENKKSMNNPVNDIKRDSQKLIHDWQKGLEEQDQAYILEQTKYLKAKWYD